MPFAGTLAGLESEEGKRAIPQLIVCLKFLADPVRGKALNWGL